ncbi:RNA polymerase III subunit GL a isoform 2 [Danio rerio]|uniref:RNA polymerase III subunit GL a n=1 Tax=Danio rerio TaxID=7955 RepID=A0A0R4INA2_DANRE|nr:RNA polymerase III subunit GL a isoform 2 [Danio rerio]|eukprot:NP_001231731.1 polymerase (RNA) III (DNA directed) polypeptide G like a isoform 2 [Danio rerio]
MAGMSRGRGRNQFTFNVDALGFGRGDSLPTTTHTPSPLFPPMQFQPVPLHTGEEVEYMLALKQELRASSKNLPFHIRAARTKRDVSRYSDKYQTGEPKNNTIEWSPDWSRLPKELCIKVRKPRKTITGTKQQLKQRPKVAASKEDILQKLEETDYIASYFDNGEDFGGDSDDNMDEAVY